MHLAYKDILYVLICIRTSGIALSDRRIRRMATTRPPFRADHVGSLLRPRYLLDAHANSSSATRSTPPAFRALEDKAVLEVIKLQEDVGLLGVTDGEIRRGSWHMDYIYQIGGIRGAERRHPHPVPERGRRRRCRASRAENGRQAQPAVDDLRARLPVREGQHLDKGVPKLTIPSPSMVHYRGGRKAVDEAVYPDLEEFYSPIFPRSTPPRSPISTRWAAPISSSTIPASPTSTIRRSAG